MKSHRGIGRTVRGRVITAAAAAAIALGAASYSAAGTQQTISQLTLGFQSTVNTLDGAQQPSDLDWAAESYGVEPLVVIGSDGNVKPWLAESVANPDPLTYIYTLRRGIKFWDGAELTAADAANALNYYRGKTATADGYSSVRSVTAHGRYQVFVTLKRPDSSWQFTPAISGWIFEKKFQEDHGADMGKPGVLTMGTGPWEFDSLDPTQGVELSANPSYWGGKVPIDHLSIKFIPDPTNMALAFRAGNVDIAVVLDPRGFAAASGARVTVFSSCRVFHLSMNTKVGPWSNIHVRRAAAYAINRSEIIQAAGGPQAGIPVGTIIDPALLRLLAPKPAVEELLNSINTYPFNLQKAKQELSQSPYPNGFSSSLDIFDFGDFPQIMQAVAGNFARIGIKLDVKVVPPGAWFAEATGPKDKIPTFFGGTECNSPYPGAVPEFFVYGKNVAQGKANTADYTNPKADALIEAGKETMSRAKQFEIYSKLVKILANDEPYLPLYAGNGAIAFSPKFIYPRRNPFYMSAQAPPDRGMLLGIRPK
jgi:peptide/nickel transport system substrate-binding protein